MAEKGGTGEDAFKLTVKVGLVSESNVAQNILQELQKIFESDIIYLHQHFQCHPELRSQNVDSVNKGKKRLRFEFSLKSANELEQLCNATKDGSLANALSEYSKSKGLHTEIGLGSKQLCFKCEMKEKHYRKGCKHFKKDSRDEESDEADIKVKYFYLYLPCDHSEIKHVFIDSNQKKLHGKELQVEKNTKHLWGVKVHLNPDIRNWEIQYRFGVKKCSSTDMGDFHILESSTIERKYWKEATNSGVLAHVEHIMCYCREDMENAILQLETLITNLGDNLKGINTFSLLEQLEKQNICVNDSFLLFALLLAKFEQYSFLEKSNENLVTKLFQALCLLTKSNLLVPSTCAQCLHRLSYHVIQKKFKTVSLVQWMTYMFPFQPEAKFLEEIRNFCQDRKPIVSNDKESMDMTLEICKRVRERILKKESEKGPEFLIALLKELPLEMVIKVHSDLFDKMPDLEELGENILNQLVVQINTVTLKLDNNGEISKLKTLWESVKSKSYVSRLTGTFEKRFLSLLAKTCSFSDDYHGFCEDDMLFVDELYKKALLQLIAGSQIKEVHEYMKTLMQGKKFLTVSDDVVEKWFETALDKHIGIDIVSMYTHLCDMILLQQPGNNEDLTRRLETKLYTTKIKSLKPAELVKMADQISSATEHSMFAQEIFQHHLEQLLRENFSSEDPMDILSNVLGLRSDWNASLVTMLLDFYGMKDGRPTQVTVFSMLHHQNFWKAVLQIQGVLAEMIKMHPAYITADDYITFLKKSIKDMTITVGFIEKVASEGLMVQVASFLADDGLPEENYLLVLEEYHNSVIKQREMITLVRSTMENITKYISEVDDLKERVHMIAELLKTGNITIREMKETLWQPYDSIPSICEKLQIPSKSSVFWNVYIENKIEKVVKRKEASDTANVLGSGESVVKEETVCQENINNENLNYPDVPNTVHGDGIPVLDGLLLLKDLCEKGCDLYKKVWEDFYKGNDLSISVVKDVFRHGVNIPEEINYIEDFEGKSLNSVSGSALLDYWNLQKYENTVRAMTSSLSAFMIRTVDDDFKKAVKVFEGLATVDADSIQLFHVHHAVKTVKEASCMLDEGVIDMLNVLGKSSTLISFLCDIVDEDIRYLIDADEEVSEKYVKESTVSGLIQVKCFLHPFLIKDSQLRQSQYVFFREFAEKFKGCLFKDAVSKTTDCA